MKSALIQSTYILITGEEEGDDDEDSVFMTAFHLKKVGKGRNESGRYFNI